MKILFSGNDFKYETEATVKLFIPSRFTFHYDITDAKGDIVMTRLKKCRRFTYLYSYCRIGKKHKRMAFHIENSLADKSTCEHELCRLVYLCLQELTGITPPWGLLTGIRPVKKMTALIGQGKTKEEAFKILRDKFMVSDRRLEIAYLTARNQLPLIESMSSRDISLYISIPFCPTRCSYCSFVSHSMDSAVKLIPDYIRLLAKELEIISEIIEKLKLNIDTIYIGGGTPTSISATQLKVVMDAVSANFDLNKIREYSVEAGRADTITPEKLRIIKAGGATRISVNPQTFNDNVLKIIGRHHTAQDTINAFFDARDAGFENINMDLIAGLPGDATESFHESLYKTMELSPESITVHTLTIKRSARLYDEKAENFSGNHASVMADESMDVLPSRGYLPYYLYRQKNTVENLENIGFAKKGYESLYNIFIMDETQTILGAGCAASTKIVDGNGKITRIHNHKFPYEYINRFDELMKKKTAIYELLG
ncbi:MAG: coproporphyrinogen dehydrogenase HemZ [Porcipelethomonas sp.]